MQKVANFAQAPKIPLNLIAFEAPGSLQCQHCPCSASIGSNPLPQPDLHQTFARLWPYRAEILDQ